MTAPRTDALKTRLENVIALARLLERIERTGVTIGADQYRALVVQLKGALATEIPAEALRAVLGAHPATAELYENIHYAESGLSFAPLDRSVDSEMRASEAIARARRG